MFPQRHEAGFTFRAKRSSSPAKQAIEISRDLKLRRCVMKSWMIPLCAVICVWAVAAHAQVNEEPAPAPAEIPAPAESPAVQYHPPIPSWYGGCCEYPPSHAAHVWDGYCHHRHRHGHWWGCGHGCGHFCGSHVPCKSHCCGPRLWHGYKGCCQKGCRRFHLPKIRLRKCCPRPCGKLFHHCRPHCCGKGGMVIDGPVEYRSGDAEIPVPAPPIQGQST